jgi:S1-C subfamily serine protease
VNIKLYHLILGAFFITAFCSSCVGFNKVMTHTGLLSEAKAGVQQNANDADAHYKLGKVYDKLDRHIEAVDSYENAVRINPDFLMAYVDLGYAYNDLGQNQNAITAFKGALRINPDYADAHIFLGHIYDKGNQYQEAIASFIEVIRVQPDFVFAYYFLGDTYTKLGQYQDAVVFYKKAIQIKPELKTTATLALINRLEQKVAPEIPAPPVSHSPQPSQEPSPQSGTGSGFFVSKMGHVITNAHVVQNCKKITIGDNANKQVSVELINTDRSNDLALLKLSTLEMASAESKSLIQKLSIVVVPLSSKGLLRSDDVKLGEKVLVAGYPFGELFSNTIKVTSGIVSATRGAGDDSGQFQLDAAVQPGNSGGPIYDSGGNIVGVVVAQLDKRMMEKTIGSLPENVNFGIKASTVRQFLMSSGLPSKKAERTEEKSTEQLAEIAKNQALMVMCLQ